MQKYIIDDRIFEVKFSCDLHKCKGACCTLKNASGAPILDEEVMTIKSNLDIAKKYLAPENIDFLESYGFLDGSKGDYSIKSIDHEDCVFSYNEEGITKCAFQSAYNNQETEFRKPISCHLFPIRVSGAQRNILKYEEIYECRDALAKGKQEDISVFEFSKDSIWREYGEDFYEEIRNKFLKKFN